MKGIANLAHDVADVELKRIYEMLLKLKSLNEEREKVITSIKDSKKCIDEVSAQIKDISKAAGYAEKEDAIAHFASMIKNVKEDLNAVLEHNEDNEVIRGYADVIYSYYTSMFECEVGEIIEAEKTRRRQELELLNYDSNHVLQITTFYTFDGKEGQFEECSSTKEFDSFEELADCILEITDGYELIDDVDDSKYVAVNEKLIEAIKSGDNKFYTWVGLTDEERAKFNRTTETVSDTRWTFFEILK